MTTEDTEALKKCVASTSDALLTLMINYLWSGGMCFSLFWRWAYRLRMWASSKVPTLALMVRDINSCSY